MTERKLGKVNLNDKVNGVIRSFIEVCLEILSIDFEILTSDFCSAECPFDVYFSVYDVLLLEIYVFLLCYLITIIKREVNVEWTLRPGVFR